MEFDDLKESVKAIGMSDEMQERVIKSCRMKASQETEEFSLHKPIKFKQKRIMYIAAVVALCLCVSIAAAASGQSGFFQDIKKWNGAVVGQEYVDATNEIEISADVVNDELIVSTKILNPDSIPYCELDTLEFTEYEIIDENGNVIMRREGSGSYVINDGNIIMTFPLETMEEGEYKLLVESFTGEAKADQPLIIKGNWEADFDF